MEGLNLYLLRLAMKKPSTKKSRKKKSSKTTTGSIHFIVPMPGRSNWQEPDREVTLRRLHKFSRRAGDLALEDFQAQILMQREYFID